jgi:hypothetical protein
METVACPSVKADTGFRAYQPQARRLKGETVCEQVLTPVGDIRQIPAVSFSFFDPRQGSYRTVQEGPFPVTIIETTGPGQGNAGTPPPPPVSTDNRATRQTAAEGNIHKRPYLPVVSGIALVALVGVSLGYFRKKTIQSSNKDGEIIPQESPPELNLETLQSLLAEHDSGQQCHTAVFRALQQCLGDHYHLAPQSLTADIVETHLRPEGSSDLVIDVVQSLFRECDRVRYGGGRVSGEEMEAAYQRLKELRRCLETVPGGDA